MYYRTFQGIQSPYAISHITPYDQRFSRTIGLAGGDSISPEAATILIERRSALARCAALVVVLGLLGVTREDLSDGLGLFDREYSPLLEARIARRTSAGAARLLARELGVTV